MASVSAGASVERPSYSKIAASGLKPPGAPQSASNTEDTSEQQNIPSSPRDGSNFVSPSRASNSSAFTPKQQHVVPVALKDSKETGSDDTAGPQVHVQGVDTALPHGKAPRVPHGMLQPTPADESGTQVSSSSGSAKPPSLDGKSVTSGTTFALDEKESLRPDDSASVKATDDEDVFSPPESGPPDSRIGSDDGARAFHDQLREISSMEPSRQSHESQSFGGRTGNQPQGVLYMPPQGSGVGTVPGANREPAPANQGADLPPDPKLLEALDSPKDRIMVLKLEQDIVDFVKDAKESSLKLPQTNAFYRMLAHKLADYYMLGHIVDDSTMAVRIFKTPNCRLPPPLTGIATPSTAASTPPPVGPQMKILRRGADATTASGSNTPSKTTSENGESGNDEDKKPKVTATREEREARYEAARKRILGSAKPSESPEEPIQKDESRPSSTAGKRMNKKKQRSDTDDDFEARSAYSAYYPPTMAPNAPTTPSYGYPNIVDSRGGQFSSASFSSQENAAGYPQYGASGNGSWPGQALNPNDASSNWMQSPQAGYDLSGDFQRSMNLQPTQMPAQNAYMQPGFGQGYNQQYGGAQQQWQQQASYTGGYSSQHVGSNYAQGYPNRSQMGPSQFQEPQTYQYGQLPSQTFPGRPSSKLEHPLPGSYKSKHFNPQSQSFIPGQANSPNAQPQPLAVTSQQLGNTAYASGYNAPSPAQRHNPSSYQNTQFGSQQQSGPAGGPQRAPSQQMTHPLPQPVFPRQPSPNVPLPPKPDATPPKPTDHNGKGSFNPSAAHSTQGQSSIAKWGTPASLPAKPPPSAEPFDPARFAQAQRQPSQGSSRTPNSMPSFGSMPPMASGHGVSGQSQRRG